MKEIFGTDGIRGEANREPMDAGTIMKVGQAVTVFFRKNTHHARIIVGKDTRLSGYMVEGALEAGITSMGGDVFMVGVLPTPAIAFLTADMRADAGVMISASHNPFHDNGIKLFSSDGKKLSDKDEIKIEKLILNDSLAGMLPKEKDLGRAFRIGDAMGRYIVFLKQAFPKELSMEGLKVVMDLSNGATYRVAPRIFSELGAEVEAIHAQPDGININEHCGSQYPEDLAARVKETGAAVGLAFDGDGDRLIAVDEKGSVLRGDHVMVICAETMKQDGKLKNNILVSTVMSNLGVDIACDRLGIKHVVTQVGDRYVLEEMLRIGAVLGGEDSGHTIFLDHLPTGDGILTALKLIEAMLKRNKPLSELSRVVDIFPQELINITVKAKPDLDSLPGVKMAIDEVQARLGKLGRVLVRYSGTQPMCRVMVEGPEQETTRRYCEQIADAIRNTIGQDDTNA